MPATTLVISLRRVRRAGKRHAPQAARRAPRYFNRCRPHTRVCMRRACTHAPRQFGRWVPDSTASANGCQTAQPQPTTCQRPHTVPVVRARDLAALEAEAKMRALVVEGVRLSLLARHDYLRVRQHRQSGAGLTAATAGLHAWLDAQAGETCG